MSYILPAPFDGLTSVAHDATLTGDGTSGDPLSVVSSGSVYSVAKTVFTNAGLPPYPVPSTVYPDTATWFTDEIASADADFTTSSLRFNTAGTYKVEMQMAFEKIPAPSHEDLQLTMGFSDALGNPPLYETYEYSHFESNDTGIMSPTFTTILEVLAGDTLRPFFILGGTPAAQVSLVVGNQAGWITAERVL